MMRPYNLNSVVENVRLVVYEKKDIIISKEGMGVNENTWKSYQNGIRQMPIKFVIELANKLGIFVEEMFYEKEDSNPNPNPYDIDKSLENILSAIKYMNKKGTWATQEFNGKTDRDYSYKAQKAEEKKIDYIKKNMRFDFFLALCNCMNRSAEDILRGNFEKITKERNANVAQEAVVVQK